MNYDEFRAAVEAVKNPTRWAITRDGRTLRVISYGPIWVTLLTDAHQLQSERVADIKHAY